ncbi:glycosyltransferase family 29 protein [Gimesia fumaroli]|uniref:3-deoxy-manno-octulosonate cytidylyltransferase n=1 Tax=Gimesia fumaroli TaxID=2527976 RepID=A0A518IJK9_9PLAN|nr:glycosyltransferase family 29 protein [Gimesia fumaroli]QDV53282.1 3-deoxy-manno-octulosonate cytidylyltransferase [Gimesia fumaroli]
MPIKTTESDISVIIPAKGNSTRIPKKNLQEWRGKPLLLWSIEYALSEGFIPYVTTEDAEIKAYAQRCGARVIDEPEHMTDLKYQLLAEWLSDKLQTDLIFLPCTSPLRRPGQVHEAVEKLKSHDSVFVAARLPSEFVCNQRGKIINRAMAVDGMPPYSQELVDDPHYLRTGSLMGVKYPVVQGNTDLLHGDVSLIEAPWNDTVDIDYPEDLERPNVVVVGNASNLKDRKIGWLIDDHDVVVRTNHYLTEGFEASVGSKTTHWSIVCIQAVVDHFENAGPRDCSSLVEVWPRHCGDDSLYATVCSHLQNAKTVFQIGGCRALEKFERFREDRRRTTCMTTGVHTIANAIDRWGGPIHIAGFGSAEKFVNGYYYDESRTFSSYHDYELERQMLNEWESDGYIKRIDQ